MSLYSIFKKDDCVYGTNLRDGVFTDWMWYPQSELSWERFWWRLQKIEPDYETL